MTKRERLIKAIDKLYLDERLYLLDHLGWRDIFPHTGHQDVFESSKAAKYILKTMYSGDVDLLLNDIREL